MEVDEVTAAGGVVYRDTANGEPEVLLILRRGVWDLPKGTKEEDESIRECACREVAEETGMDRWPVIVNDLRQTYHEYVRDGKKCGKTTYWFAMRSEDETGLQPQKSEGIERADWIFLTEAERRVGFENLRKVLAEFRSLYDM